MLHYVFGSFFFLVLKNPELMLIYIIYYVQLHSSMIQSFSQWRVDGILFIRSADLFLPKTRTYQDMFVWLVYFPPTQK